MSTSHTADLTLRLRDFATTAITIREAPLRELIVVSAARLCSLLDEAEEQAAMIREGRGAVSHIDPRLIIRRCRETTPIEDILREDEARLYGNED